MREAERLTLAVLTCGVVALALSDFVTPLYWFVVMVAGILRLFWLERFSLSEMHASLMGWAGFVWVLIELMLGRDFLVACTDFMLILALVVVVEAQTPRNHLHRLLVGMFLMLAAAVLTDSVLYILTLAAFLFFTWRAARRLYGLKQIGGDLPLGPHKTDLRVFAAMLFATSLMFVSVPRVGLGTASVQSTHRYLDVSGFSDRIGLGDFARSLDTAVVMRVEPNVAEDRIAQAKHLLMRHYWRGTSLDRFNGHGWEKSGEIPAAPLPAMIPYRGDTTDKIAVSVYREAVEHPYIFLPDNMAGLDALPQAARWMRQGSLKFESAPRSRVRVPMWLGGPGTQWTVTIAPLAEAGKEVVSESVAAWAREVTRGLVEPKAQIRALVSEMSGWEYDLNATIDPRRPIEHFIGQKRGHCELYASALTLAARSLGLPARVVNGYRGGDWNEPGGFLLIRKKHAHSWTEIWIDGAWQRYDATPNVVWDMTASELPLWESNWEAVKLAWYRYVLDFTNEDRSYLWQGILAVLREPAILLLLLPLLVFAGLSWRRILPHPGPAGRGNLWPQVDTWLIRHGVQRNRGQPLRNLPAPKDVNIFLWQRFVSEWERQAYIGKPWSRWTLRRQLRALL